MQFKLYTITCSFLFLFTLYRSAYAQPGSPNTSFGVHGVVKQRFHESANAFSETTTGIVEQQDGKYIVSVQVNDRSMLLRLLPDGTTDLAFGTNGYSEPVRQVGVATVMAGKDGSYYQSGAFFTLAHFNADGTVDRSFGIDGVTPRLFTNGTTLPGMAIQPDGKIVLTAGAQNGPNRDLVIIRFNTNGSLDASFAKGGILSADFSNQDIGYNVTIQADNKILVAGALAPANTTTFVTLFRFDENGKPDSTFGGTGRVVTFQNNGPTAGVKQQPDGKILLAGGTGSLTLARYQPNGALDFLFGNGGTVFTNFAPNSGVLRAMELLPDGKILLAADVSNASRRDLGLARFNPSGTPDLSFGAIGKSVISFNPLFISIRSIMADRSGHVLVAANSQNGTTPGDFLVIRTDAFGAADKTFATLGLFQGFIEGEVSNFASIAVQTDGKIVAAGASTGSKDQDFVLARYQKNGSPDTSFGMGGKVITDFGVTENIVAMEILPDGKILAGGNVRPPTGTPDFAFARYHADGTPDQLFGQGGKVVSAITTFNDGLNAIAVQPDGKFLAGGFTSGPQGTTSILARYNYDGSPDISFGQNGKLLNAFGYLASFVTGIKVLEDGKILVVLRGNLPNNKGNDIILARYTSNGAPDLSFGNSGVVISDFGINDNPTSLLTDEDGSITVGGSIDFNGTYNQMAVMRYHANGSADLGFGNGGVAVYPSQTNHISDALSIQPDGKLIVSGQESIVTGSTLKLVRFNHDGTIDAGFGTNGVVTGDFKEDEVFTESVISGDNIYLAGTLRDLTTYASIVSYIINQPVRLTCPSDVFANSDSGRCAAIIKGIDPIITPSGHYVVHYELAGDSWGADTGTVSGLAFNPGVTNVTYKLEGDQQTCSFNVYVNDNQFPSIINTSVSTAMLWPANHKMRDVLLQYEMIDNCGVADSSTTITSNEPGGEVDWEILSNKHIRLRAERLGGGNGRIYTITVKAVDGAGLSTSHVFTVMVPKNMSGKGTSASKESVLREETILGKAEVTLLGNPTTNTFGMVVSGTSEKVAVRIMTMSGILIERKEHINAGEILRFGANYKPGLYLLEVSFGNERRLMKLVKH